MLYLFIILSFLSCNEKKSHKSSDDVKQSSTIKCDDFGCEGQYKGPEFINGDDIAHQFSNKMSAKVGDQLKKLYAQKKFVKVDFNKLTMYTEGMGTGNVIYSLNIPFEEVNTACEAFTSFDHVGGWNHSPALEARKKQLSKALLAGDSLDISSLKTTPEGLQEYWIQWRHKQVQASCN